MDLNATLIIEVLSFLILLGLLGKFLYRPVLGILDRRAQEIRQAAQNIQEGLSAAERERAQAKQMLLESKNEALRIKEQVRLEVERLRQKILRQAEEDGARIVDTAHQEIIQATARAKEELKAQAIELSIKGAEQVLRREFAPEDQKRLIKELSEGIDGTDASSR